jgi:ABC-2 type transport system ATP-binding protein
MKNIIQTEDLSKSFGETKAVDEISLHVRQGEIYGFLGLNGAGKTTTIRLLLGMIKADSGSIQLFGETPKQASQMWNDVGYLVETPHSYPDLSVRENLEVIAKLRGLANSQVIDDIIDNLALSQYRDKKARHLSMGNNQRLGLAKALIHKPKLLILDEPINGLDPAGIVEIRELLKKLVLEDETTIFLSSHILSEIAKLATRIGIVHNGRLIEELTSEELDRRIIRKLRISTINNRKAMQILNSGGFRFEEDHDNLITSEDEKVLNQPERIATLLVNEKMPPKMLDIFEEDLESFFLRIIHSGEGAE